MKRTEIATPLLTWYKLHARDLPWRRTSDPYAVWVSEIMLQQTRVETVIPYYQRWIQQFRDVTTLANASLQVVLTLWEGLGYYSRARNIHRAAGIIAQEMDGKLPSQIEELRKLPGIGRYTAGAIASIAFGADEPALDANARRVLGRCFNVIEPVHSTSGERRFWELAREHLPSGRAGEYNQALMDLGALVCISDFPECDSCPLFDDCQARFLGIQSERPVVKTKAAIPHYLVSAAIITRGSQVLIAQRPENGLLGGLWEFPGGKQQPGEDVAACLQREIKEELGVEIKIGESLGKYKHAYTHFRVTLQAYFCSIANGNRPHAIQGKAIHWVDPIKLNEYPMGKIDRLIAKDLQSRESLSC